MRNYKCCICGKVIMGVGNKAYPYRTKGYRCCDKCNRYVVIPTRNFMFTRVDNILKKEA